MSEPFVRSRPGPGGYNVPAPRAGAVAYDREDPLAELARLVGKDDPFRNGPAGVAPQSNVRHFPQLAAPQDYHAADEFGEHLTEGSDAAGSGTHRDPTYDDFDAQLRGSLDARRDETRPRDSLRFPAVQAPNERFEPAVPDQFDPYAAQGEAPPLNADLWAEGMTPQGSVASGVFDSAAPPEGGADTGSPRRTMVVLAAVLLLTGGGLGATFLMREGPGHFGGGAPPTILAAEGPTKIQSPDAANSGNTDANTALLEKTGSDKVDNAKVVNATEQPVDLNQLPKATAAQTDSAAPQGAAPPSPFPAPRKVKTILIRPDGSVVGEASQAAPAQAAMANVPVGMVMPPMADGSAPQMDSVSPSPASEPVAKPSTPKSTARISVTPKDASVAGGASGARQAAAPARAPKPKPVAVADADTDNAAATTPGSYSVQLAAPGTEQEAKDTASRLQKKFAGELGSMAPSIHKADRGGKTIYRVRVSNLSQDDAKGLCTKLQSSGGSCFVVRN